MKNSIVVASAILASSLLSPALAQTRASFGVGLTIVPTLPDMIGAPRPTGWNPRLTQPDVIVHGFEVQGWVNAEDPKQQAVVVLSQAGVVAQQAMLPGFDLDRLARCEALDGRQAVAVVDDTYDRRLHRKMAHPRPANAWWVSEQGALDRISDVSSLRCEIPADTASDDY